MKRESDLKVALVCDWLTEVGGAEKVLLAVHEMFPDAPIYTSQFRPKTATWFTGMDIRTGWLNIFPKGLRRFIPFLRNIYFKHLDLSDFDLVISVANAEAKGVKTRSDAVHIAYLQGPPTQYYWGMYDEYIKNPGFGKLDWLARIGLKILVKPLRKIDYKIAQKPDYLLANSSYVQGEIKKYYGRDSFVLWPNVDVAIIKKIAAKTRLKNRVGFIMTGRQVSWKRADLAIEACIKTNENLLLIGGGPENKKLVASARGHDNIKFLPRYNGPVDIVKYFKRSKAFIFPSVEPFGITPVEAIASGTPVIALRAGGALDIVNAKNGIFFEKQTVDSLVLAIKKFNKMKFNSSAVSKTSDKFSDANFKKHFQKFVLSKVK